MFIKVVGYRGQRVEHGRMDFLSAARDTLRELRQRKAEVSLPGGRKTRERKKRKGKDRRNMNE